MPKKLTASLLDSLYRHAESVDRERIDRIISYGRLKNGDHFQQSQHRYLKNSRSYISQSKQGSSKSRLRLTQNHISRFVNVWTNSLLNMAPDVEILPDNPQEEKDRKVAQLNRSVKAHIVETTDFYSLQEELVDDFITLGEAIIKMQFNANIGPMVEGNIQQAVDEQGFPAFDEQGQPILVQDLMPSGLLTFTRVEPENLLRDPVAKSWKDVRWVCYRHMMDKKSVTDLIKQIHDADKAQTIINSLTEMDESVSIYQGTDNMMQNEEENRKVNVREFYWRPSLESPKGKYVMSVKGAIIFEQELPAGIFPFEFINFENNHGTPRGESRIKQLKGVQLEINRCVSKMAEHQITLGDDKIITTAGSKIAEIKKYEGVRHFQVSGGQVPAILEGRAGTQYLEYYLNQINIFNILAEIPEITDEKLSNMDPFAIFFLSSKQKTKYAKHASKFERFQIQLWKKALQLFKHHVHPAAAIPVVGSSEKINIDELKSQEDLGFLIKLKPRTEDPESLIAKQFQINQFLQYSGGNMDEADFGVLAKESPFFHTSDFALKATAKAERAQNMILKLDKGLDMPISQGDDPDYMLSRLDTRVSQADFDTITHRGQDGVVVTTEQIQQLYNFKREEYINIITEREQKRLAEQAGEIPTTGGLIPVQMYEAKVQEDGEITSKRVQLPNDSLEWLINTLKAKGMTDATLGQFTPQSEGEIREGLSQQDAQINQAGIEQLNTDGFGEDY